MKDAFDKVRGVVALALFWLIAPRWMVKAFDQALDDALEAANRKLEGYLRGE